MYSLRVSLMVNLSVYIAVPMFQEPLCSVNQMDCVKKINMSDERCEKSCQGIYVTSYYKNEKLQSVEKVLPQLMKDYNKYKRTSKFPPEVKGKYISVNSKLDFYDDLFLIDRLPVEE